MTVVDGMGPLGIVEVDPLADNPVRLEAVGQLVQISRLVFERPPQTFDEDVVHVPASSVHRYLDLRVLENTGELEAGELAALIRIENLRLAESGQRLGQGFDTEPDIHGVRQPPGENMTRRPVHDRHQIQKAALNGDIGDVGAPDLIGTVDHEPVQKIRINCQRRSKTVSVR